MLTFAVVAAVAYSWLYLDAGAANERTRLYLSIALVDHGTLAIDAPIEQFGRVVDRATYEGRYYTDKAPGASLLGAIFYGMLRLFVPPESISFEALLFWVRLALMAPLAGLGFVVFRRWLSRLDVSRSTIDLASLGWMLATPAFYYAGAFFSHHLVAISLVSALWLIERIRARLSPDEPPDRRSMFLAAGAGASLGFAGLTEYTSAIPCLAITAYVLAEPQFRDLRLLAPYTTAAGVFVGLLAWYHWAAFGGPFEIPYHHLTTEELVERHRTGLGGIAWPRWTYLRGLMLSLHRGLLATAPWLLFALAGPVLLYRDDGRRRLALLLASITAGYVLLLSGYELWYGGWGFGPRLLVPAMPLFAGLAAIGFDRAEGTPLEQGLFRGLLVTGLLYNQLVPAFAPHLRESSRNPLMDAVVPMLREGRTAPNLLWPVVDSTHLATLVPLALLVATVALFMFVRGNTEGHWDRIVGFSLAVPIAFFSYIALSGPSWMGTQTDRFLKVTERRAEREIQWFRRPESNPFDHE